MKKQIGLLLVMICFGLLLAACGGDDGGSELTYKVTGDAEEVVISFTTETGGKEETAVIPPWENRIDIGDSFGFELRVDNMGQSGSVSCEVWINGKQVGAVTGQQFAQCTGSFTGDRDTSSTSFISSNGDFEMEAIVVAPSATPTMTATAVPPTITPMATPTVVPDPSVEVEPVITPLSGTSASISEMAALTDIVGLRNVVWSPDGTQLATSEVSGVQIWQFAPDAAAPLQKSRWLLAPTEGRIVSLIWSFDGAIVVGGSKDGVWVWDAASGELLTELPHEYGARSFSWSPDGRFLASSSNDGYVRLWDAANNWQISATLINILDTIREVAWSPDGTFIAATEKNIVHLWDAASGDKVGTLEGHNDLVGNLAWSPDGQRLATTSDDQTVRIWDAAAGTEQLVLEHASYLTDIAWSPDGIVLAAGTGDDEIQLWNAQSGENLLTFTGLSDSVTDFDWSDDGTYLAAASLYAGETRVWRVKVDE